MENRMEYRMENYRNDRDCIGVILQKHGLASYPTTVRKKDSTVAFWWWALQTCRACKFTIASTGGMKWTYSARATLVVGD